MSTEHSLPETSGGYLICPCTGELPFVAKSADSAASYLATEEYYAVSLPDMYVFTGLTEGSAYTIEVKE